MKARSRIHFADARRAAPYSGLSAELVVTSPPYWSLKDYGVEGEVGFAQDYETYIQHLDEVWARCWAVLRPGGRMCINVGDQFLRARDHGRYRVMPIRSRIIATLERLGADYMGAIIWQKLTTTNTSGGGTFMGSFPHPRNGILKIDYEFILVFKKPGRIPSPGAELKAQAAMSTEEWSRNFTAHWTFPGERQRGHHAMFPVELPRRLVRMFTFPGETVLDPFAGAGTTLLAALEQGRVGVGIELNRGFEEAIRTRLGSFADEVELQGEGGRLREPEEGGEFFGSAVRVEDIGRDRWKGMGKVEAIPGPLEVQVSGRSWRLEGLGEPVDAEACRARLEALLGRRKVDVEPTSEHHAYLRLANRTMVNAVLLKEGLATADPERKHRNRARFIRYAREAAEA